MKPIKKVGILTFHRAHNYGAVWQCWALKCACESMGCLVQTIDFNPYGHYTIWGALRHSPWVAYKQLMFLYKFNRFVNKFLNPTEHIASHKLIMQNPPQCDVYIVGSDQVWANAIVGEYLNSYLLDFAPEQTKRIAYAVSTGGNPLVTDEYQLSQLQKFSAISLRENQSKDSVQEKVKVQVTDVCDPSLLITADMYQSVEKRPCRLPKNYIVYFDLAGDNLCAETAQQLGRNMNLPIINVAGKYKKWAKYNYSAPSPEEWLYILHHADYICTNSFHAVSYSIIFRHPFICCVTNVGSRSKTNGRMYNLLEQIGLLDRYADNEEAARTIISEKQIHYNEIAINTYRNRSLEWLKTSLEL